MITDCLKDEIRELYPNIDNCIWHKQSEKPIGSGVKAVVYRVCCGDLNNCNFAAKVIKRKMNDVQQFYNTVEREVKIHKKFAEIGLGPSIKQAFICEKEAVIVMDRIDTNVKDYIEYIKNNWIDEDDINDEINKLEREYMGMLKKAYEHNLFHDDLHAENLGMYLNSFGKFKKGTFIDFGESYEGNKYNISLNSLENDLRLTFNMYRKSKVQNRYKSPPKVEKRKGRSILDDLSSPMSRGALDFTSPAKKLFDFDD